ANQVARQTVRAIDLGERTVAETEQPATVRSHPERAIARSRKCANHRFSSCARRRIGRPPCSVEVEHQPRRACPEASVRVAVQSQHRAFAELARSGANARERWLRATN